MTIYVVGSCQAIPLANCLALMSSGVAVKRFRPGTDLSAFVTPDDVVFRQRENAAMTFATHRRDEILYPRLWFNAFHPDVAYVQGPAGPVQPPLGTDHSSLVLYGWHRGLDAAGTVRLFNEAVFERLGFFDCWDAAKQAMLEEGEVVGFPLGQIFARLERQGCFMRTPAHPGLFASAEIARELVRRAGLPVALETPEYYLDDAMLHLAVWPVYPEVGRRLGLPGVYAFKPAEPPRATPTLLDLDEFVARAYEAYAHMPPEALACARLTTPEYRDLESIAAGERKRSRNGSPYAALAPERFWRRAIERVPAADVDPVGTAPFTLDRRTRIATAGSCFAQSMSHSLTRFGYNYFVTERAPDGMPEAEARPAGYGVFSTRCGNIYTARQLLQLFDRAYGTLTPDEVAWVRPDGRHADPFRPQIEPDGFTTVDELIASRSRHLEAVRTMFEQLDVFIFTLGLTEAWRSKVDGAVFPLAPGVVAGRVDASRHEFVNFTAANVRDDLDAFVQRLNGVNPRARIVLTVSPQPPIATYEPRHVLVSATYTKAALRVAADEVERAHAAVWYFPGYEIIAGAYNRGAYYEPDLRTVTAEGVGHVMRLFLAHCAAPDEGLAPAPNAAMLDEHRKNVDVLCDEEAIDAARPVLWTDYAWYREFPDTLVLDEDEVPPDQIVMDALDTAAMRAPVQAEIPRAMRAGTVVTIPCAVRNDGGIALGSTGTHPVFLCYRWFDAAGDAAEVGRSLHTPLSGALEPGVEATLAMRIAAPQLEGRFRLRVALLQSEVAWFDDVDPGNGVEAAVDVFAKNAGAR